MIGSASMNSYEEGRFHTQIVTVSCFFGNPWANLGWWLWWLRIDMWGSPMTFGCFWYRLGPLMVGEPPFLVGVYTPKMPMQLGGGWPYRLSAIGVGGPMARRSRAMQLWLLFCWWWPGSTCCFKGLFQPRRDVLCMFKHCQLLSSLIQVVVFSVDIVNSSCFFCALNYQVAGDFPCQSWFPSLPRPSRATEKALNAQRPPRGTAVPPSRTSLSVDEQDTLL